MYDFSEGHDVRRNKILKQCEQHCEGEYFDSYYWCKRYIFYSYDLTIDTKVVKDVLGYKPMSEIEYVRYKKSLKK